MQIAIEYKTRKKNDDLKIRAMLERRRSEFPRVVVVAQETELGRYPRICSGLDVELISATERLGQGVDTH